MFRCISRLVVIAVVLGAWSSAYALEPGDSKRLAKAKDHIAEEQWARAIDVLRQAVGDPKETSRDEALYWLAHSLSESGDPAAALQTIKRLETDFPSSLWVKPAGALRIQMAVRMRRDDVLWYTVTPPPPPPPPAVPVAQPPAPAPPPRGGRSPRAAVPPPPPAPPADVPGATPRAVPLPPPPPPPPEIWIPGAAEPDVDLRIQALTSLLRIDADRVIPMLAQIALDENNPAQASRAVFVLAQSGRPEARETVVRVARNGAEPVRIAAVRELGRFGGPEVSSELLHVYATSGRPVKQQVVKSLAEREERAALLNICTSEQDVELRKRAIGSLARIGGGEQLTFLYARSGPEIKRPIIASLVNVRADGALIMLADRERDAALRREIVQQLRLLGTPRAREYVRKVSQSGGDKDR